MSQYGTMGSDDQAVLPCFSFTNPATKKHLPRWLSMLVLALLATGAAAQTPNFGLSFEQAVQLAQDQASALQARSASVAGAVALQASAAQLPDPRLTLGVDNLPANGPDRFSLTRDFMTMRQIGWMQEVPNRPKRLARSDAAQARSERERALLQAERLTVRREAALAWLARYFAERRQALLVDLEKENRLLQDTVAARVAGGKTLAADALQVRQEALALADRRDELQRETARARANLRRWVGSAADMPLTEQPPVLKVDAAQVLGNLERHAEFAMYTPMAAMAQAEAREAEAAKRGDWAWSVAYAKRGPAFSDMVSVQFSFELPLWPAQRQDPQIAAKRREVEQIEAQREDMLKRRAEEVASQLAEESELGAKRMRLQDQALPLAQERLALLMASYQAGRAELPAVLAARKELAELRLRGVDLQAQHLAVQLRLNSYIIESQP